MWATIFAFHASAQTIDSSSGDMGDRASSLAFPHAGKGGEWDQGTYWPSIRFPWRVDKDAPISQSTSGKWLYHCCRGGWLPGWGWGSWGLMVLVFPQRTGKQLWIDLSVSFASNWINWRGSCPVCMFFVAISAWGVSQIHSAMLFDFDPDWWSLPGRQERFHAWIGAVLKGFASLHCFAPTSAVDACRLIAV